MSTVTPTRPSLTSFWHDLPREGKLMLSVVVFEFLGTGLVLPFHVVYLHEVRGFALSDVGLLLALPPLVGFVIVGPGGALIDRIGARRILVWALCLLVAGDLVLAFASTLWAAGFALSLSGMAFGVSWPASQSFIAAVVPVELRQRYFGVWPSSSPRSSPRRSRASWWATTSATYTSAPSWPAACWLGSSRLLGWSLSCRLRSTGFAFPKIDRQGRWLGSLMAPALAPQRRTISQTITATTRSPIAPCFQ